MVINTKGINGEEDLGLDGKIILKVILKKQDIRTDDEIF